MRCENDPSRFACRTCGKTFGLARLLNRHMKCHSDSKRYLCTFCGKGFNDTFDLKRHTTKEPEAHYLHLKTQPPYSPALLKFYDKRHFKFNSSPNFSGNAMM